MFSPIQYKQFHFHFVLSDSFKTKQVAQLEIDGKKMRLCKPCTLKEVARQQADGVGVVAANTANADDTNQIHGNCELCDVSDF